MQALRSWCSSLWQRLRGAGGAACTVPTPGAQQQKQLEQQGEGVEEADALVEAYLQYVTSNVRVPPHAPRDVSYRTLRRHKRRRSRSMSMWQAAHRRRIEASPHVAMVAVPQDAESQG